MNKKEKHPYFSDDEMELYELFPESFKAIKSGELIHEAEDSLRPIMILVRGKFKELTQNSSTIHSRKSKKFFYAIQKNLQSFFQERVDKDRAHYFRRHLNEQDKKEYDQDWKEVKKEGKEELRKIKSCRNISELWEWIQNATSQCPLDGVLIASTILETIFYLVNNQEKGENLGGVPLDP
ncbi:MAG: hypothetical protein OXC03_00175 [Flavobacteriaceae bacterium]|nr:hypothetical protein [Flavobacteriaceae bacterium]